jgi:hypothetical protein
VARAVALLAVADSASYTAAERAAGRRSNDAVAHLVAQFNRESLSAIEPARIRNARPWDRSHPGCRAAVERVGKAEHVAIWAGEQRTRSW